MRLFSWGIVLAAVPATAMAAKSFDPTMTAFQQAGAAFQANDCAKVLTLAPPAMTGGMKGLSPAQRDWMYDIAIVCSMRTKKFDDAYRFATTATKADAGSDYAWTMRLALEMHNKEDAAALATIEAIAQKRKSALNAMQVRQIGLFSRRFEDKAQRSQKMRLLKILADPAYQPTELFASTDSYRMRYAVMLAEKGDVAGARSYLAAITNPNVLISVMFDPRLKAAYPSQIDVRKATEAKLANDRAVMAANTRSLRATGEVAYSLRRLGRIEEAVHVLKSAEGRMTDPQAYDDFEEYKNWWWDGMGRSYAAAGKYDEAAAAFRKGATLGEDGSPNVSQTINLAALQNKFGRYQDALATLAPFDSGKMDLSPYGHMAMRTARGCAHARLGQTEKADADLAYLIAHEKDSNGALADLYLCRKEIDKAAAIYVRRLDDPDLRASALDELSDYDARPVPIPTDDAELDLNALKARDDVKAAIVRAGGTRKIPLQRGDI